MEKNKTGAKEKTVAETKPKAVKKEATVINENTLIKVKSGFYGKLYYKNLITQERVVWERQGDVQIMPMRELRAMRTTQPAFFKNQWVVITGVADGEDCNATPYDICKALAITEFYKNFIDPSEFALVCNWDNNEIADKVKLMSPGARENLIVALNQFIKDGSLDSIRKIKAFEDSLGCELRMFE